MQTYARSIILAALSLLMLLLAACATEGDDPEPEDVGAGDGTEDPTPTADEDGEDGEDGDTPEAADLPPFAMVLSGPTSDGDYNALGLQTLNAMGERYGIETGFSEEIPVGDAARVAQEYIIDGFGIISMHTGLYLPITMELAPQNPDTIFISQGSGELEEHPDNVWHIGRRLAYNSSFFIEGYLAGLLTETNTVAFIGGAELPDAFSGANSFFLGAREANPDVELLHTFTGDFDDPVTARRAADSLTSEGADVMAAFLNAAIGGVAEAAEAAEQPTYFMGLYTDKRDLSEDAYVMSPIWNFEAIFEQIFDEIAAGESGGFLAMSPQTDGVLLEEIYNVPEDVEQEVREVFDELVTGEREVPDPSSEEIEVPEG